MVLVDYYIKGLMEKDKGGRPTAYCKEIVSKAREYLTDYKQDDDVIPSIEGLCAYIELNRSTIYRWRDEEGKEEFKDILEQINTKQQRLLVNNGLSGKFNSAITKLILGVHGISEKHYQEVAGVDGKPLITTVKRVIIDNK